MKDKKLTQIKNTLETMRLYVKDSENMMNEYEGSYTLHQLELNCDRLEETINDLRNLINDENCNKE